MDVCGHSHSDSGIETGGKREILEMDRRMKQSSQIIVKGNNVSTFVSFTDRSYFPIHVLLTVFTLRILFGKYLSRHMQEYYKIPVTYSPF